MPFDSEKQRKYLWAAKPEVAKKIAYKQTGGAQAPLGPASAPPTAGLAAPAIQQYVSGTGQGAPLAGGTSYSQPGTDYSSLIDYHKGVDQLQKAGIDPTGILYRDTVDRSGDDRQLSDIELQRMMETGHAGQVLGENTIGGWREWGTDSPQGLTADERLSADYSHLGNIPGVGSALAGGIGGLNRKAQRGLREAGGVTYNIGGQPVTVGPDGSVAGTLPAGVNAGHIRDFAVKQGHLAPSQIDTRPSWLKKGWSSVSDIIGQKKEFDAAEADRVAREQAAARLARARTGSDQYRNESDDDFRDRTQAASSRIDWSAPSDADLEDVYGGTDWSHGFRHGGPVPSEMEDKRLKIAKAVDFGKGRGPLMPTSIPPETRNRLAEAAKIGAPLVLDKLMPGAGQFSSLLFNKGGDVSSKGYKVGGTVGPLASVKYKSVNGKESDEYERKYHNPLMSKGDK